MEALRRGEIDLYPEYTGTALLADAQAAAASPTPARSTRWSKRIRTALRLTWLDPAPTNNTQALATTGADRREVRLAHARATSPRPRRNCAWARFPNFSSAARRIARAAARLRRLPLQGDALDRHRLEIQSAARSATSTWSSRSAPTARSSATISSCSSTTSTSGRPITSRPVVRDQTLKAYPAIADGLNRIAPLLDRHARCARSTTRSTGQQKREAGDVARDFIKAHGLA